MNDDLSAGVEIAQSGSPANYMLYAELTSDRGLAEIPLTTARFPKSGMTLAAITDSLRVQARSDLTRLGYEPQEVEAARFVLGTLPEDVIEVLEAEVRKMQASGADLVLFDVLYWEAAKQALCQTPRIVGRDNEELTYKGLRIRRSAVD